MEMGAKKRERPGGLKGGREGKMSILVSEGGREGIGGGEEGEGEIIVWCPKIGRFE